MIELEIINLNQEIISGSNPLNRSGFNLNHPHPLLSALDLLLSAYKKAKY